MKTKIQIKSIFGKVLFELEKENNTIKETIQEAIRLGANMRYASMSGADMSGADMSGAYMSGADMSGADMSGADMSGAYMSGADMSGASMSGADMRGADMSGADMRSASMSGADMRGAYMSGADMSGADMRSASMSGADMSYANMSGAVGIFNKSEWFNKNFQKVEKGYIVYKAFGNTVYSIPSNWIIKAGEFITEVCNPVTTCDCGCGVNFATKEYLKNKHKSAEKWFECLLYFEDMPSLVVPYNTDGKCRCERLQIIRQIEKE